MPGRWQGGTPLRPLVPRSRVRVQEQTDVRMGVPTSPWEGVGMHSSILVVEDFEPVREIVETCLTREGYEVKGVADGRSALAALDATTPDLVLLDVRMPDISGWDLLALLRHSKRHRDMPIIMLTAMSDAASQSYGWQLGCTCYLTKPVNLSDLLLVIHRVLNDASQAAGPSAARESRASCIVVGSI
jgi:DNA-binding response OmpR family regulator